MIKNFTAYILESRKSIDELEMLNPAELGKLLLAEIEKDSPDVKFIQDLLYVGCPIDARDNDNYNRTALHVAAYLGILDMVEFLISKGAEVNARDSYGYTVLHLAAQNGKLEMVEFLLSNGAELGARDIRGRTALHWAADFGHIKVVEFLISKGAQLDIRNNQGFTAWGLASNRTKEIAPELNPNK